jgi:hypothetical protein
MEGKKKTTNNDYVSIRIISFNSIALMMEAARTSETLVNFYQTTRCYNPEDSNLHTHRRGTSNPTSFLLFYAVLIFS